MFRVSLYNALRRRGFRALMYAANRLMTDMEIDMQSQQNNQDNPLTYGTDWPVGSVIEMFETQYRIRENNGRSGEVEYLDGTFATSNFAWWYLDEKATLISLPKS